MLSDNNFGHSTEIVSFIILKYLVIFGAVNETHHIGILLDCTGFTKVTQLRTFSFKPFTTLDTTIQLRQSYNRNIQLFGKPLQRT